MSLQVWLPLNGNLHNQGLKQYNLSMFRGSEVYNNNGKIGKCFYANGANTIKILNIIPDFYNYSAYSLCAWIYIEAQNTSHSGCGIISAGNWNNQVLNLGLSDWSTNHYTRLRISGTNWSRTYTYNFSLNTWYHIVVSSDSNKTYAYVNGVLIGDSQTSFLPTSIEGNDICIGGATYYAGMQFFGRINDVRIYDHCLSEKEVREIAKGLILHYKLDDTYAENSNIISCNITETAYNAPISKYGYNDTSNLIKTTGNFQGKNCVKIGTRVAGQQACPYAYFGNLFTSDGTNAPAYKALSFDYYTTVPTTTWLNIYKLGSGQGTATWKTINSDGVHSGTYTNSANSIVVKPNEWNHVEVIFHGTTTANAEWGYCINGPNHVSSEEYYFLYANIQLEENNHVTGYGESMHSNIIYDSSGYNNNGTIAGTLTVSENTSKYKYSTIFDGNTAAIQTPNLKTMITDKTYTISCWTYKTQIGSKNYQTIYGGPGGFELEARSSSTTNPLFRIHNWGGGTTPYEFGQWYHFCFVHTDDNSKLYINGELKITGTSANIPSGNYFIGAWNTSSQQNYDGNISDFRIYATALTEDQILELYHTSATIDNNGNVYAREVVE